jgi:hypothetical protein
MKTAERADHLARAASAFPFLGITSPAQLLDVVRCELGSATALDNFAPYGGGFAMARPPETILHILSGNTPHAGLQSLIRGLLLGSMNLCKIPSAGLPEIAAFRELLPRGLAECVEIAQELAEEWLRRAGAVIVFGSDETIAAFRARTTPEQIFIGHGNRVSFGVVFEDVECVSAAGAAQDVSLFDQQGCLSPHLFYVAGDAEAYASAVAREMAAFPASPLSSAEAVSIAAVREEHEFRAATTPGVKVWKSAGSLAWTVVLDDQPRFTLSCLNRLVYIKPLPESLDAVLRDVRQFLSTIAIWPPTLENALRVRDLGATRICAIGSMQAPPFTWHQDGLQTLAPLVRWIDAELLRA